MKTDFPASWAWLANPHARKELVAFLRDAADVDAYSDVDGLKFLVHFFFDDHDFDSGNLVGEMFFDEREALAVDSVVRNLNSVIGPRNMPMPALTKEIWLPVAQSARLALDVLSDAGKGDASV